MKSSVYISAEKIQVIGYKKSDKGISVKKYVHFPLPEGTVINGKIIDHAYLSECLAKLRSKNPALFKEPSLVADGSSIVLKKINVPSLSKSRYIKFLGEEFAEVSSNFDGLVCGYSPLGSVDGKKSILACAADRAQVESYISVFKAAGIRLNSIKIGTQTITASINARTALKGSTFILNVIDGYNMISMIFDKGVNVFASRTRLYSESHEQLLREVLENLSGLVQFNKSEKFSDIVKSYYIGLNSEDISMMSQINPYPDIEASVLDIYDKSYGTHVLALDAHFPFLNALYGDDCIDLIECCKSTAKVKDRKAVIAWIPALVVVVLMLASVVGFLSWKNSEVEAQIKEAEDYINSEDVVAKLKEINDLKSKNAAVKMLETALKNKIKSDTEKPEISKEVLDLIINTMNDRITVARVEYSDDKSYIRVEARSTNQPDQAEFIERLKESKYINSVSYSGFTSHGNSMLSFSVEITLRVDSVAETTAETTEESNEEVSE